MIASLQNPLVKEIRKLHRAKGRREQNLFLLEGTHLVETACQVNCSLVSLCCTADWQTRYPQVWEIASQQAQRTELVTPVVLQSMATTQHPDGVIATAVRTRLQQLTNKPLKLGLVLEGLQDPGNLGTIIRTAAAVEADGIWLSENSVDIDNPKVLRSSAGAWFRIPLLVSENLPEVVKSQQAQEVQIIATLSSAKQTFWQLDLTQPTLILLGNEGAGLSDALVRRADATVSIPISQGVESLNVAIAAALLLYEAKRQQSPNQ